MQVRDFMGVDFDAAARLVGRTWHARHGEHSFWQGADELCAHLSRSDHGFVATDDADDLVGVALVQSACADDANEMLRMHWLQQRTRIAAMAQALGVDARADVVWLQEEEELEAEADATHGTDGVGRLLLLIVEEDARGQGVGTSLLDAATAWLAAHGARTVRLVTDDECDWQFYEGQGMSRLAQKPAPEEPDFYLYVYEGDTVQTVRAGADR